MAVGAVHPFEAAGLGQAPFRCVGRSTEKYQACPGAPIQPGASCSFCGTGIMDVFHVLSADGRRFGVGCDCVRRVYATFDGTIPPDFRREMARLDAEKREAKRLAAWERLKVRVAVARATLEADPLLFSVEPHPHAYHAKNGLAMRDYFLWLLAHGGSAGKTDACRAVETATANHSPVDCATAPEGR